MASKKICNNCTTKLIQLYIFIQNTEERSKMLKYYLDELYNKTCYISDCVTRDSNSAEPKIYNVVISMDNKVISDTLNNSKMNTKKAEQDQNKQDYHKYRQILQCVTCNMFLPSFRAWKLHERTTHKRSYRCRICLQSYKTQEELTTHYKTHLKPRCTLCNRIVRDGTLLRHLNRRHKHLIHLCTTCNVAYYSTKALESHMNEYHYRGDSECVTCLKSLTREELESHQCRFKCTECVESPCVHHKYLMCHREQVLNLADRAKCLDCSYVCTNRDALITHVNMKHLNYSCGRCGQKFYSKSIFNRHVCTPEEISNKCHYCKKQFDNQSVFWQQHENSCEYIKRKFPDKNHISSHESSKDEMKHRMHMFSCDLCERVFLNEMKRRKHILQAHNRLKKNIVTKLDCVLCETKFVTKAAWVLHQKYHRPDSEYTCKVCKAQFSTLRQLKAHNSIHTPSSIMCEVCGKWMYQSLLKRHLNTHHK